MGKSGDSGGGGPVGAVSRSPPSCVHSPSALCLAMVPLECGGDTHASHTEEVLFRYAAPAQPALSHVGTVLMAGDPRREAAFGD